MVRIDKKIFERGLKVADSQMFREDKIWSRYSNDKVDIGETLARVIRTLSKALPLTRKIRALSIGSSNEPQFRILETACNGGLYLLDIEQGALDVVRERIRRQRTGHVFTIRADYDKCFLFCKHCMDFLRDHLHNQRMNLVTLHHSLYYCNEHQWQPLYRNLYRNLTAPVAAMHAVLMARATREPYTTSWLYEHFVGKFFGQHNTQDLQKFRLEIEHDRVFNKAQILAKKSRVQFFVNDFEQFMAVVWMVLLYPNVHRYSLKQREEITEFIYKHFWIRKRPLWQIQDHLVVYRGVAFKGLI